MPAYNVWGVVRCRVKHRCNCAYCHKEFEVRSVRLRRRRLFASSEEGVLKQISDEMVDRFGDSLVMKYYEHQFYGDLPAINFGGLQVVEVGEDQWMRELGAPVLPGLEGL